VTITTSIQSRQPADKRKAQASAAAVTGRRPAAELRASNPEGINQYTKGGYFYHATPVKNLESIRDQGLKVGSKPTFSASKSAKQDSSKVIYLSKNPKLAADYANTISQHKGETVILKVKVPAGTVLDRDERSNSKEDFKHSGDVPKEWISKDHFVPSGNSYKPLRKLFQASDATTQHPLEAAAGPLPGQIERVIVSLQNDGRLPIQIPPDTMRHVSESLAKYFKTASQDKIEQFAEAAKAAVEAELKTENVQTVKSLEEGTTGVNVGATPATSRGVLTSFIESATGDNIGGLMNMDFFNRIMREVTQGAGNFVAQNFDQTRLDEFPALELHRVYDREVPRGFKVGKGGAILPDPDNDWPSRWEAAGGELVNGRMVALKSDPIWQAIGDGEGGYEDTLGNPFAPFAFNSGFDTDEVSREDAVALGLMDDEDEAKPADFDFTQLLNIEAASAAGRGALEAGDFDEDKHPRDEKGRWAGGGISLKRAGEGKEARWVKESGEEIPEHVAKLGIPPAWKNVRVAPGPEHDLQAIGEDVKGRVQRIYSDAATERAANEKFSRNSELLEKQHYIFKQNEDNLTHENPGVRENAACMKLIQQTGIRPGSDTDTGAEKQAYGATTLEGRHVHIADDGSVRLKFIGKKGVDLDIPVEDKATARMLIERKETAGESGKLFNTDDAKLRDYSHTLDGGGFKPKDFRTLKGTNTAIEEIKKNPAPAATMKDYKKRVMDIAKKVSQKLGNTPTIALQSYINPSVFARIKPA
jgi:DNA topoisomerase-1